LSEALKRSSREDGEQWLDFNINEAVMVKLNDEGVRLLKRNHDALWPRGAPFPFVDPRERGQGGWVRYQMWQLMEDFGPYMSLGSANPFDTTIKIKIPAEPSK
jgi:hypothetical protein